MHLKEGEDVAQSSKRRQDDETLSQIEELEKKLDEQMSGMYQPNTNFGQEDESQSMDQSHAYGLRPVN